MIHHNNNNNNNNSNNNNTCTCGVVTSIAPSGDIDLIFSTTEICSLLVLPEGGEGKGGGKKEKRLM